MFIDPLTTKDEPLNNDEALNIMNVKEEIKEEETLATDPLHIKEEPAFIDKADADVNVKEEETDDYLYDSENIDKIDIEEFKLEDPDV